MRVNNKKILDLDASLCLKVNRLSGRKVADRISFLISRLGDGSIYFLFLAIFIIVYKKPFFLTARDYLSSGAIHIIFYKLIKGKVKRRRPFSAMEAITKVMPPPDEFSFPSGHSGAAAAFCYCTFFHMPVVPFVGSFIWMLIIGFSRIYNGVHYPGDVIAGYIMGVALTKGLLIVFYFN